MRLVRLRIYFETREQELITRAPITKQFTEIFEIYPCEVIWLIFGTRNMKYLNLRAVKVLRFRKNDWKVDLRSEKLVSLASRVT